MNLYLSFCCDDLLKAGGGVSTTTPMERKMRAPVVSMHRTDDTMVDEGEGEDAAEEQVLRSSSTSLDANTQFVALLLGVNVNWNC